MIGIIDYGSGNIQAIRNIYKRLKTETFIIREPKDISIATKLILPGVGSFDYAITKLDEISNADSMTAGIVEQIQIANVISQASSAHSVDLIPKMSS